MRPVAPAALLAAFLAAVAGARPAAAQELEPPRPRQGYYVAAGLLGSVQHITDDGDRLGFWPGPAFSLRLGQLLTRRYGLGFQLDLAGGSKGGETSSAIGLGVGGQMVLVGNLALHAVLGLGVVSATRTDGNEEELRGAYGAAYTLGLSWDFIPRDCAQSGGWALTPLVLARAVPGDPLTAWSGMLGMEVTWWSGLPRNQQEIPLERAFERE